MRFPTAALQFGGRAKAAQAHSSSLEVVTRQPPPDSSSEQGGGAFAQPGLNFSSLAWSDGAFPCPYIKPSNTEEVCLGVGQGSLTRLPDFVPSPSGTVQGCQAVSVLSLPRLHLVLAVPQLSTAARPGWASQPPPCGKETGARSDAGKGRWAEAPAHSHSSTGGTPVDGAGTFRKGGVWKWRGKREGQGTQQLAGR